MYQRNQPFSSKTTIQIGLKLFDQIKVIHDCGYLYLDVKLNNILIGNAAELSLDACLQKIRLIDFGLVRKYRDEKGDLKKNKKEIVFKGNIIFASKHLFNMESPSRRDDFISLCYLLIYLI